MRRKTHVVLGFALISLLAVEGAWPQYYYESSTITRNDKGKASKPDLMRGWVDGQKVRIQFPKGGRGGQVEKGGYLLTTNGGEDVYMVDPKEKTYMRYDMEEMMGVLSDAGAEGMFEIEMSDFQSEKLAEGPGDTLLGRSTTHYKWRSQFTMDVSAMGMRRTNHNDTVQDVWVHKGLGGHGWRMFYRMLPAGMKEETRDAWAQTSGLLDGFPMKSVSVTETTNKKGKSSTMTVEMEVTELREEAIPASTFEIPPDYTETQMISDETKAALKERKGPMSKFKGMFGKKNKKKGGDG